MSEGNRVELDRGKTVLHNIIRVTVFIAAVFAGIALSAGPAAAVTPQQCEQESNGRVDWVLDPSDPSGTTAVCTCKGGFYNGQQVFGPHVIVVAGAPRAVTCVGLEIPA
ncbi:hypothetical protein IU501_11005 [Nocardia otitidiscaviarum]|uniref:hypothetical protein n=1 Tax=Nocardia otitidiscaviarum TaxID=1823 RepID=UPI00189485A7|nr:hypothetical protein [Nocardia otitidiscaviarum]MBF6133528.1 hypothetical protein [Nocardia otitidiscaviarum]